MTIVDKLHLEDTFASLENISWVWINLEKNSKNISFESCNNLKVGKITMMSLASKEVTTLTHVAKIAVRQITIGIKMQPLPY